MVEWLTIIAATINAYFIAIIKYSCSVVDVLRMFHDSGTLTHSMNDQSNKPPKRAKGG